MKAPGFGDRRKSRVEGAIQNAASVASLLITTKALIAEKPKKEERMPAMPPGGGMY